MHVLTKAEARKLYRAKRASLSQAEVTARSEKIKDLLFSRIPIHRYSGVHIFLPILKNNEPDTYRIIETLVKDFPIDIYISKSLENGEMMHVLYNSETQLVHNRWGISEPVELSGALDSVDFLKKFEKEDILVLVPLLAFDKKGNRVGYGKGYYDRFLANSKENTTKIGISLFEPLDEIVDADSFDVRLNYGITPDRVYTIKE